MASSSVGSLASIASSSSEVAHSDENAVLRHLSEKAVVRLNHMKKALMEKTVALLAEQQLRKSAEGRLGAELRKAIRFSAMNQELTSSNTKLQQLLREAKAEVERVSGENTCLRMTFKELAGNLHDVLQLGNISVPEHVAVLAPGPLPDAVGVRVCELLRSSAEVFQVPDIVSRHTTLTRGHIRCRSSSSSGSISMDPATPDRSDASDPGCSAGPDAPSSSNDTPSAANSTRSSMNLDTHGILWRAPSAAPADPGPKPSLPPAAAQNARQQQQQGGIFWRVLLSREAAKPDAEEAPGVLEEKEEGAPRGRAAESDDEVAPPKGGSPPPLRLLRRHSSSASSSMDELSCASVTSSPVANKEQEAWQGSQSPQVFLQSEEAMKPMPRRLSAASAGSLDEEFHDALSPSGLISAPQVHARAVGAWIRRSSTAVHSSAPHYASDALPELPR